MSHVQKRMDEEQSLLQPASSRVKKDGTGKCFWQYDIFPCVPARYVLVVVCCFGFINVYSLRGNLSLAIVVMVNDSANTSSRLVRESPLHV